MTLTYRTIDDPEANSRTPLPGDQRYTLKFPLDCNMTLHVECGRETMNTFAAMLAQMIVDDADGLPTGQSTPMPE